MTELDQKSFRAGMTAGKEQIAKEALTFISKKLDNELHDVSNAESYYDLSSAIFTFGCHMIDDLHLILNLGMIDDDEYECLVYEYRERMNEALRNYGKRK